MSDEPNPLGTDPIRNFKIGVDERIRALTIGPPAYALRKRKIEDLEAEWVKTLVELHDALVAKGRTEEETLHAMRARADRLDYARINRLVAAHNRWYPVEANLAMGRHGNYLVSGRIFRPEDEFTPDRLLEAARSRIAARANEP